MRAINLVEFALVFHAEAQAVAHKHDKEAGEDNRGIPSMMPHLMSEKIDQFRKLAVELERLNLNACNYGLSDRQETRQENVIKALGEICAAYGMGSVTQGDPRGAAAGILTPLTQRTNSWGGAESGFRLMFDGK